MDCEPLDRDASKRVRPHDKCTNKSTRRISILHLEILLQACMYLSKF